MGSLIRQCVRLKTCAQFLTGLYSRRMHTLYPSQVISISQHSKNQFDNRRSFHSQSSDDNQVYLPPLLGTPIPLSAFLKLQLTYMFLPWSHNLFKHPALHFMTVGEFIKVVKDVQCMVSDALAKPDFDALTGLVTEDALAILQEKVNRLTDKQRRLLRIKKDNYIHSTVFNKTLKISQPDSRSSDVQRIVEVHVVSLYHPEHLQRVEQVDIHTLTQCFTAHYVFERPHGTENEDEEQWIINSINYASVVQAA